MSVLGFDKARAKRFRAAVKRAQDHKLETFWFDGHEFVTRYGYYLVSHLADRGLCPELDAPLQITEQRWLKEAKR